MAVETSPVAAVFETSGSAALTLCAIISNNHRDARAARNGNLDDQREELEPENKKFKKAVRINLQSLGVQNLTKLNTLSCFTVARAGGNKRCNPLV